MGKINTFRIVFPFCTVLISVILASWSLPYGLWEKIGWGGRSWYDNAFKQESVDLLCTLSRLSADQKRNKDWATADVRKIKERFEDGYNLNSLYPAKRFSDEIQRKFYAGRTNRDQLINYFEAAKTSNVEMAFAIEIIEKYNILLENKKQKRGAQIESYSKYREIIESLEDGFDFELLEKTIVEQYLERWANGYRSMYQRDAICDSLAINKLENLPIKETENQLQKICRKWPKYDSTYRNEPRREHINMHLGLNQECGISLCFRSWYTWYQHILAALLALVLVETGHKLFLIVQKRRNRIT